MLALACIVLAAGCSKRNEALCCESTAECTTIGFSSVQPCDLGVCVNYQCTSVPGVCDDDHDCNGTSNAAGASTHACVANTCAVCATSDTCPASAPICDETSHDCRTCTKDAECDSGACDLAAGTCVDRGNVLYTSAGGTDGSPCTMASPCSLAHAAALVDTSHTYIVLSRGSYLADANFGGKEATLIGNNAVIDYSLTNINLDLGAAGKLNLRDLSLIDTDLLAGGDLLSAFDCSDCSNARLTLTRVSVNMQYLNLFSGIPTILQDSQVSANHMSPLHLTADRVIFKNADINTGSATITNSLFASCRLVIDTTHEASTVSNLTASTLNSGRFEFYGNGVNNELLVRNSILSNIYYPSLTNTTFHRNLSMPDLNLGNGNISEDPMFTDPANYDFHLMTGSPAIDAADPNVTNDRDLEGVRRPQGAGPDIGAFEHVP